MDMCRKKNRYKEKRIVTLLVLLFSLLFTGCDTTLPQESTKKNAEVTELPYDSETEKTTLEQSESETAVPLEETETQEIEEPAVTAVSLSDIPEYDGSPYVEVQGNKPDFSEKDMTTKAFETYSEQDPLGRCGVAFANVCIGLMPTEKRGEIGQVRPSGWQLVKYNTIDGKYLYNRCHLIAYQLAGENANEKNLITGTRYLNVEGMLPFENRVADYVKETGNHVLYRVTPLYKGDNLVASGVEMEALSVEDGGKGISFHVFCYNVQPGIHIDYANGDSYQEKDEDTAAQKKPNGQKADTDKTNTEETKEATYILNTNTHKFHHTDCRSVKRMKEKNKEKYTGDREKLIEAGYDPCQNCNP